MPHAEHVPLGERYGQFREIALMSINADAPFQPVVGFGRFAQVPLFAAVVIAAPRRAVSDDAGNTPIRPRLSLHTEKRFDANLR